MKVIVAGSRECKDYKLLCEVIEKAKEKLGISIDTIISGECRGVDKMGEEYAKKNKINLLSVPAEWDNLDAPGAIIKERANPWKKTKEKYNAKAGFDRNEKMAEIADVLIAINLGTSGTQDMINRAKKHNLLIYVHSPGEPEDELEEIIF